MTIRAHLRKLEFKQTNTQTDRQNEFIQILQLRWNVLQLWGNFLKLHLKKLLYLHEYKWAMLTKINNFAQDAHGHVLQVQIISSLLFYRLIAITLLSLRNSTL